MARFSKGKQLLCASTIILLGFGVNTDVVYANNSNEKPLAVLEVDIDGDNVKEKVELIGKKLMRDTGYHRELMLLLKDNNGKLISAYEPQIDGGYFANLSKGKFLEKGEQIILAVGQGKLKEELTYRIIDFSDKKDVKEIYTGINTLGLKGTTQYLPNYEVELSFNDGTKGLEKLQKSKKFYQKRNIYNEDGSVKSKHRKPNIGPIISLINIDLNGDGKDEILGIQNITGANKEDLIGVLSTVWSYDDGWSLEKKEFYSETNKDDKFRRQFIGRELLVLPQTSYLDGNSIIYPRFVSNSKNEVVNAINDKMKIIVDDFLKSIANNTCEFDYTITFAGKNYLSLVLFGVKTSEGTEVFLRQPLNFDLRTGNILQINDVFNVKNKNLLPVVKILTKQDKVDFTKGFPSEWYFNGKNLVFCQKEPESIQWNETVVAVEDMKNFLLEIKLFDS